MRVVDYIMDALAEHYGVRHIFMISGGGAMHLTDALGRNRKIKYICNHHEQACTMAAEGYARISGKPGVALVTSGPGGGNAITGVMGAWLDSIPMLVMSGQVKVETTKQNLPELRQLGDQEINIIDVVRPLTKYSVMITEPSDVRYHLERAMHLATQGRPGPVWLDIPLDIQSAQVEPDSLRGYDPVEDDLGVSEEKVIEQTSVVLEKLMQAKRPVIIAGNGVRLSGALAPFKRLIDELGVPLLTGISGIDLIASDHPLFFGRPGILGDRAANFILQNSDCLIILGARMNIRVIGYDYENLARDAYKIMVDIDPAELEKPTLNIDLPIHADVAQFIGVLEEKVDRVSLPAYEEWKSYCLHVRSKYPMVLDEHRAIKHCVSSYVFPEVLSQHLEGHEIIATANGTVYTSTYQVIRLKEDNRMFANVGCATMGYGLPAAIGACLAGEDRPVLCLTGDGSIQMNLQELQTVIYHQLPIKIFMYNNDGYVSIKNTQKTFFDGFYVGSSPDSGVGLPDMKKIAATYGFPVFQIRNHAELEEKLPEILRKDGPLFCEIMADTLEFLSPKTDSVQLPDGRIVSRPIEDLAPFLPREDFLQDMIIDPIED